jgi:hypothetical protein
VSVRLRPIVAPRWLAGISDGFADPLWALGAPAAPPSQRSRAAAALDAAPAAPLCPGSEDRAAPAPRPRAAPGRVRDAGGGAPGAHGVRLAHQPRLRRAPHSSSPSAWRRYWTARHDAGQTRGRRTAATGLVAGLFSLLRAPYQRTAAVARAAAPHWDGRSQAVAVVAASAGRRLDRSCLDTARGLEVARAPVATVSGGMSKPGGRKPHGEGA